MNEEYERILNLDRNEDFIKVCFKCIQGLDIRDVDFEALIDVDTANEVIMDRNRFTYPIIVEVPVDVYPPKSITHIKGARRYYSDKYFYKGKYYLLCNDWYYITPGKKNTKDTRIPFIKWLKRMETK
jgi:hypothetical protein